MVSRSGIGPLSLGAPSHRLVSLAFCYIVSSASVWGSDSPRSSWWPKRSVSAHIKFSKTRQISHVCHRDVPHRQEARPQASLHDPRLLLAFAEVAEGRRRKLTDALRFDGRGLRATAVSAKSPWWPTAPPRTFLRGECTSEHALRRANLLFRCVLLSRWLRISQTTRLSPFYSTVSPTCVFLSLRLP